MDYITHNQDASIDIYNTSLQGYVVADYYNLVRLFGNPEPGDGNKTDAEWRIKFQDGTIATIYNWKNGRSYRGSDGTPTPAITTWNIGGISQLSSDLVHQLLSQRRG